MTRLKTAVMFALLWFAVTLPFAVFAERAHRHTEPWYSRRWCAVQGGLAEYTLPDGTRADCVTPSLVVEVEWAHKWAEAVGQALYYATYFPSRLPAVVLLVEDDDPEAARRYERRARVTVRSYNLPVQILVVDPCTLEVDAQ